MKLIRLLFITTLIFSALDIQADELVLSPDSIEAWDNSIVDYRVPGDETIEHYRALPEYKYDLVQEPESLLSKILRWIGSFFTVSENGASTLFWVFIALAVLALVALVIKLAGIPIKGLFVFSKSTKVAQLTFGHQNVNLEEQELDSQLNGFILNKAYREATRILFLQALRALNRKGYIIWNAFKTDREYYFELKHDELKHSFYHIIQQYEYIWYGKFEVTDEVFENLKGKFSHFISELEQKKAS